MHGSKILFLWEFPASKTWVLLLGEVLLQGEVPVDSSRMKYLNI